MKINKQTYFNKFFNKKQLKMMEYNELNYSAKDRISPPSNKLKKEKEEKGGKEKDKHNEEENEAFILDNYKLGKTLGEGTFGKVKLGIHKMTGEKVNNK